MPLGLVGVENRRMRPFVFDRDQLPDQVVDIGYAGVQAQPAS
jgi:hypothetical protein